MVSTHTVKSHPASVRTYTFPIKTAVLGIWEAVNGKSDNWQPPVGHRFHIQKLSAQSDSSAPLIVGREIQ
jgi:hypothetical protein